MSLKKAESIIVKEQQKDPSQQSNEKMGDGDQLRELPIELSKKMSLNVADRPQSDHPNIQSETGMNTLKYTRKQNKFPNSLKQTLKGSSKHGSQIMEDKGSMKKSKIGNAVLSKFKEIRSVKQCEICENEIKKKHQYKICACDHSQNFCESCLDAYISYKANNFEEVLCPDQSCDLPMDTNSRFFKQMPAEVQKKYHKIESFYKTSRDQTLKLCPTPDCDGILKLSELVPIACSICRIEFCAKCLLKKHEGQCDQHEIDFMKNNLHYRQCKKCKFIIEKNQGCNHMTCRCGFQFCYVCGANWHTKHYEDHDQNGVFRNNAVAGGGGGGGGGGGDDCCDQCCDCCECDCCQCECCDDCECCEGPLGCILKAPLKFLLFLLLSIAVLLIFILKDLLIMIAMFIMCIFIGAFGYSFDFICDFDCPCMLLMIIAFPISMIIGIGRALQEIFGEVAGEMVGETCEMYCEGIESIGQI